MSDAQESMGRYADWIESGFLKAEWTVERMIPQPFFGRLFAVGTSMGKYLGYIDKYILFPWFLKQKLKRFRPDVVCVPDHSHGMYLKYLGRFPNVVHCHDLFAIRAALGKIVHQPTGLTGRIYQHLIAKGLMMAKTVCCISSSTVAEFRETFVEFNGRIEVTPNGRNYPYRPYPERKRSEALEVFRRQFDLPADPFLLHVGGNQWYKNRPGLVRAFAEFCKSSESNVHLWLVGKTPDKPLQRAISESGVMNRIHAIQGVSNEQLRLLYSTCEAFCFPSISEGFGWPVTEAQACGAAVITTAKDPMQEVGGSAAYYVAEFAENEKVPDAWYSDCAAVIQRVLGRSTEIKEQDRLSALDHAEKYETDHCFDRIFEVYQSLL